MSQLGGRPVQATPPPEPVRARRRHPRRRRRRWCCPNPRARTGRRRRSTGAKGRDRQNTHDRRAPREGVRAPRRRSRPGLRPEQCRRFRRAVQLDVATFLLSRIHCGMISIIRRNWSQNQSVAGIAYMKFTIARDGTIQGVQVEKPSGFVVIDAAADRALRLTASCLPFRYLSQSHSHGSHGIRRSR